MMEKEVDAYYNKYKRGIITLLAVSGIWPDSTKYPKIVKNGLTVVAVFAELAVTFGILNFCLHNLTNIGLLTRGMGMMISFSSALFKTLVMVIHREDVAKLNRTLSHRFEKDLEVPENRPHLLAHYRSFQRFFRIHYDITAAIFVIWLITPILALRHDKYIRAYPQLMPFAYEIGGSMHWCIYGLEVIEGWYCWTNTVGVDSSFGLYSLHMVGELRLLSSLFRNLKPGDNYKRQLKECIDRHVLLIQSKRTMQKIFGFLLVWLAVTCAFVVCAIIFQTFQTRHITVFKVVYLIVYCTIKFIQAYTYAWFGHIINVESGACIDSIYYADWVGRGNLRIMNDVLIVLSQNPMFFNAMSLMIVRLDMVSKIMNTSVSYFFLLRTLDQKMETS